ncbi:MAG: hypothetical protein GX033_02030 [Firmicutes bacterium]|nr:hypothetical protein [Bacillota bacterium]
MEKWLKPYLIRPTVYKTFSYFLTALAFALFWHRFVNRAHLYAISHAFTIIGVCFFAMAWFNYLRLDGVRLPRWKWPVLRRKPLPFADMADYMDEEVISFEELAEEERNRCCLAASIFCGIIFFILSAL